MTPQSELERVAEAMWQAESRRAASRDRLVPWAEAGHDVQNNWRFLARAAIEAIHPEGVVGALEDCRTHRQAWRSALEIAKRNGIVEPPDRDDKSYWQHEIDAFDRTFSALKSHKGE